MDAASVPMRCIRGDHGTVAVRALLSKQASRTSSSFRPHLRSVLIGLDVAELSGAAHDRHERAARNQSLFREVNENIEELARGSTVPFHELSCE